MRPKYGFYFKLLNLNMKVPFIQNKYGIHERWNTEGAKECESQCEAEWAMFDFHHLSSLLQQTELYLSSDFRFPFL